MLGNKKYTFSIYLEGTNIADRPKEVEADKSHLVCRIRLIEDQNKEPEASLEVIDEENLPVEIYIGTKESKQLISFLKGRIIPDTRQNLKELLKKYGIAADDWIGRLGITNGRAYDDNYYIEVGQE